MMEVVETIKCPKCGADHPNDVLMVVERKDSGDYEEAGFCCRLCDFTWKRCAEKEKIAQLEKELLAAYKMWMAIRSQYFEAHPSSIKELGRVERRITQLEKSKGGSMNWLIPERDSLPSKEEFDAATPVEKIELIRKLLHRPDYYDEELVEILLDWFGIDVTK